MLDRPAEPAIRRAHDMGDHTSALARFWMIRHAVVDPKARQRLYGVLDVPVDEAAMLTDRPIYAALAARLPKSAPWITTPLSRTQRTAAAIIEAGAQAQTLSTDAAFIEQDFGVLQGLAGDEIRAKLTAPSHPFWPLDGEETPEGGESFAAVIRRVGAGLDRLTGIHTGGDIVMVSHGGPIRAAVAHALGIPAVNALHLSVHNLSLTVIERHVHAWRVVTVNELLG